MGWIILGLMVGYVLGYRDGRWAKPPPPNKGTYDSGDHEDRVDDYGDDWK